MGRKSVVTGGAGFIGSTLVDYLVERGDRVVVIDNLSSGFKQFLNPKIEFIEADLMEFHKYENALKNTNEVFHMAANADVRYGWDDPQKDLKNNLIATLSLAEKCVSLGIREFTFASTGSVYGTTNIIPSPENIGISQQTSLYAASKISAENFLGAYAFAGKFKVNVFRFVSVLGPRYTHGHIFDFVKSLRSHPTSLKVLGDGHQRKSYMHINDCINAVANLRTENDFEIINLGAPATMTVRESILQISKMLELNPELIFGSTRHGWIGDNPLIELDVTKAKTLGWETKITINEAVASTVRWLQSNPWVFNSR